MSNEITFLSNIRKALGQESGGVRSKSMYPDLFQSDDPAELLARINNRSADELDRLVETFFENCIELNTNTYLASSLDEAKAIIIELIRTKETEFTHNKHVLLHDHPDLAALNLWNRFTRESVTVHTSFCPDTQLREKTIASFVGITAPAIGIADTATLVELTRPGSPRSTSLVPSIHIALLRRENVVEDMAESYALLREKKKDLDSLTFISGPSKTADIESHLVHGAHGPCEVHIIVLSEPVPEEIATETPPQILTEVDEFTPETEIGKETARE